MLPNSGKQILAVGMVGRLGEMAPQKQNMRRYKDLLFESRPRTVQPGASARTGSHTRANAGNLGFIRSPVDDLFK